MKIAVGGMIAAGKSTLVHQLGRALDLPVMDEFEEDDEVFNTLLKWLYEGKADVEMLLQVYFIHNHYLNQKKYGKNFIVDRDIIEHWLFAHKNLTEMPDVMNMYNGLFMSYMNKIHKPDLYIILDISFDVFIERLKTRGRASEVDNLDENLEYFAELHKDYTEKLTAQCKIYDIPYQIINVDFASKEEVLDMAMTMIEVHNKVKNK